MKLFMLIIQMPFIKKRRKHQVLNGLENIVKMEHLLLKANAILWQCSCQNVNNKVKGHSIVLGKQIHKLYENSEYQDQKGYVGAYQYVPVSFVIKTLCSLQSVSCDIMYYFLDDESNNSLWKKGLKSLIGFILTLSAPNLNLSIWTT